MKRLVMLWVVMLSVAAGPVAPGNSGSDDLLTARLTGLRAELQARIETIIAEEDAVYAAADTPTFAYMDRFSATMRNMDRIELTYDVWGCATTYREVTETTARPDGRPRSSTRRVRVEYPGLGRAARALNGLRELRGQVRKWQGERGMLAAKLDAQNDAAQRTYDEAWSRYQQNLREARLRRINQGVRDSARRWPTWSTGVRDPKPPRLATYPSDEANLDMLDGQISDAFATLERWTATERSYRAHERRIMEAPATRRARAIAERRQALFDDDPNMLFVRDYDKLAADIITAKGAAALLRQANRLAAAAEREDEAKGKRAKCDALAAKFLGTGRRTGEH